MGILPNSNTHFIGLRHNYRWFESEHPTLFAGEVPITSQEYFHTTEVWGRYNLSPRIQLFGFVPYQYYQKSEQGEHTEASGLGDITLLANAVVLNTADSIYAKTRHTLIAGGGIKLPTGRFDLELTESQVIIPNMQPGTGSWDVVFNANYTGRYKSWGIGADAAYRYNTENSNGYRFGNRLNASSRVFYIHTLRSWNVQVMPQVGVQWDYAWHDYLENGERNTFTGGYFTLLTLGMDVYVNRFRISGTYLLPVDQDFGDGYITNRVRASVGIAYLFTQNAFN